MGYTWDMGDSLSFGDWFSSLLDSEDLIQVFKICAVTWSIWSIVGINYYGTKSISHLRGC